MARPRARRHRGHALRRRVAGAAARLARKPLHRLVLALALGYVLTINAAVRVFGSGDAHLLSISYLPEKSYAVLALGLHALGHVLGDHDSDLRGLVARTAREQGVPESLALAIARAESGFRPHCISRTGAMGLMQLMPATAREVGVQDPFDPEDNARGAARYLRRLLERYQNDPTRAAAAYNAGPGRVPRHGPLALPDETQSYVRRVVQHGPPIEPTWR